MSQGYDIVVCGSLVPDPLQTLEPVKSDKGPALKNEMMLPAVLDPWAAHSLYEAAHLAGRHEGSRVFLVSLGPKAKLQQLMMAVAQKVSFRLVVVDGSASGFTDSSETANALADAIEGISDLQKERLLLFGGNASASRDASTTMQMLGERLGIKNMFLGVDFLEVNENGFTVKERAAGGQYLVSKFKQLPAVLAWATGSLPEPPNNPQLGMQNMRMIMPALQQARSAAVDAEGLTFTDVAIPSQLRDTRIVKDAPVDEIAKELADWIRG
ncbi:MAG TPA: electron transfer flavoprotein subunit beta [Spirochaetota bacterium]|nr:electron transfer flavoprotein subunit beta [Spirochaetota bacterium]